MNSLFRNLIREVVREENDRLLTRVARLIEDARPTTSSEASPYMNVKQAAELAGVTERTIRDWVRSGELTKFMAGSLIRVRVAELEQYMARCAGGGHKPDDAATDEHVVAEILASIDRG